MIRKLTIVYVEYMAHQLARQWMDWDEPIPPFDTRFPSKLESCIETPFATYGEVDLYPTLVKKAAILFYLLIKNHPFQNGNKRIAVTSLMTFLYLNDKWIATTNDALYKLAIWVAESKPSDMELILPSIESVITENLINKEDVKAADTKS